MEANKTDIPNSGFEEFYTANNLTDVFKLMCLEATPPNTYRNGDNQIDYILVMPVLTPVIKAVGLFL
eukprot:8497785-Ditylum_brightwellii.AAC.1